MMKTDIIIHRIAFFVFLLGMVMVELAPSFADSANKVNDQAFFETLNDVPLMPGLYELLDESVVFDKPGGRIVESSAASEGLESEEIRSFYDQALPQMGWQRIAPESFVRQDETLHMVLDKQGAYSIVRFTVAPRESGSY